MNNQRLLSVLEVRCELVYQVADLWFLLARAYYLGGAEQLTWWQIKEPERLIYHLSAAVVHRDRQINDTLDPRHHGELSNRRRGTSGWIGTLEVAGQVALREWTGRGSRQLLQSLNTGIKDKRAMKVRERGVKAEGPQVYILRPA